MQIHFKANLEFKKLLCCGFDTDEPLSIVAFRRYLNSMNDETRSDLVKVLDPELLIYSLTQSMIKSKKMPNFHLMKLQLMIGSL